MIRELDSGTKVVELGQGTTFISQVLVNENSVSSGICFSNTLPQEGKLQGENVIIEILNMKGAITYMKAVVNLLQTWEIEGTEKQLEELAESMTLLLQKQQE